MREMPKRVLIVDDDEAILIRLESVLETLGYDTTTAWGGREALEALRRKPFDLVFLDDMLPDLSSEAVLDAIHELPIQPRVALMKTGNSTHAPSRDQLQAATDCSTNKRSIGEAVDLIEKCLSRSEALARQSARPLVASPRP